jgi:putative acetyltransferase
MEIRVPNRPYLIRPARREDNRAVALVIREVMTEFGAIGCNYSSSDPEVDTIYEAYPAPESVFFVVEHEDRVLGCGGMGPLAEGEPGVCELRKMYFLPELRGTGMGARLLKRILRAAREAGYKRCYLETLERMDQARRLYRKQGFEDIETPMGDTGHSGCNWWMVMEL